MQKQPNPNVIAIYSRKSRFTGKGESVGNQVELCRAYIRTAFGDRCADGAVVFEDEGFSGGNLNRPGFQKMMQAARQRQFRAVVVYRLDRISRSISDFSALIQELGRLQIDFVSIRESFDTSSPMGRAMMYIASVFSQLERETIAERIRDNMQELAKTGRWLGGTTPTGYTSEAVQTVTVDGKTKRACKLKLIPQEADIVRTIYQLYSETDSLTMTEAELLRRQIHTKTGRNFTRFSIKGILQNPVYLLADPDAYRYFVDKQAGLCSPSGDFDGERGILAYNRTDQEKGRATLYLPPSEWIVSVGQHPGLIPGRVWVRVQESLERNKAKSYRKPRSNEALLTGLLWCRCGSRMYPKLSRPAADGKPVYAYVCKQKEHSKRSLCRCPNASGGRLDAAVVEQVKQLAGDRDVFLTLLEKSKRSYTGSREESPPMLEDLRQQQVLTRRKITALLDTLADFGGSAASVHLKERLEELHAQDAALQSRIQKLENAPTQNTLSPAELDLLRQLLAVFRDSMDRMSVEQKRAALRTLVQKVVWDGTWAHVVFFGAEDEAPNGRAAGPGAEANPVKSEDFGPMNPHESSGPPGHLVESGALGADSPDSTLWGEDSK